MEPTEVVRANELSDRLDVAAGSRTVQFWMHVVVLLQSIGVGGKYYFSPIETESDIYGFLFFDHGWPEDVAQWIDDGGAVGCVVAGCVLVASAWVTASQVVGSRTNHRKGWPHVADHSGPRQSRQRQTVQRSLWVPRR